MSDVDTSRARIATALGLWVMVIPVAIPGVISLSNGIALASYVGLGAGIAITSGYSWWATKEDGQWASVAAAASGFLGLWLMTIPFQYMGTTTGWLPWNDIVVGIVVAWIGFKNAYRAIDVDVSPTSSTG